MKYVKAIIAALILTVSVMSCAEESSCPVNVKSDYYFKKKVKVKAHHAKRKPTASLIHISRVNYKPGR
jgi:hypothetical protein